MALHKAVSEGDYRASLEALRDELARAIDAGPPPRDLAALANQLTKVLAELSKMKPPAEGTVLDEVGRRRQERQSGTQGPLRTHRRA